MAADHDRLGYARKDTVDYEATFSAKVDLQLLSGKAQTLARDDLLVLSRLHVWKNRYDEDCVYAGITVGYNQWVNRADPLEKHHYRNFEFVFAQPDPTRVFFGTRSTAIWKKIYDAH